LDSKSKLEFQNSPKHNVEEHTRILNKTPN
jgi:hypothetical protein